MEEEGECNDIDMISSLPDEILRHIVSFLPTREAFATTVLSKRWKSVWQWASGTSACIDFDDGCYTKSRDSYHLFIRTVCLACLAFEFYRNLPLQKFRLCFRSPQFYIPGCVWQWLNMAVLRRVQHLDLSLHFPSYLINRRPTDLSPILRCTNLVVLKLHGFDLHPFPNSSSLHFPLLQVLHLQQMIFSQLDTLAHLLSASPNLHDFKATGLRFDNYVTHRKFQTSPKLLRAHVSARQTCFLVTEVVYNAHFLHLDNIYHRLLYEPHWMYHYSSFPMFHNLIHLQLVYQPYNAHWSQVLQLLHHFPKLQLLVINQPDIHSFHFEQIEKIGDCQFPPSVPPCLLLSLKRCCLNDYRGTKPEFEFARYIMQNGICLKNMTISSGIAKDRKFKMLKELSSCKRGSATCKLSFK